MQSSSSDGAALEKDFYEKSDTVLWAFTPSGIVLHNFSLGRFVELDAAGLLVWELLDGVHSTEEIKHRLRSANCMPRNLPEAFVDSLVASLASGGFAVPVGDNNGS